MTARLPSPGGDNDNWGTLLNSYMQQSLDSDGTLVTSATNSYTGTTNTNLANSTRPGLVQLAGDLTTPYSAPKVTGLQGNAVSSTAPTSGQVLAWSGSNWAPATPSSGGNTRVVTSVSTATTAGSAASTDYVYLVSGTTTLTLPTAVGNTNRYTITNTSGTTTIATTSSQTINGSATLSIPTANMGYDLVSNGTNWVIASANPPSAASGRAGLIQLNGDLNSGTFSVPKVTGLQGKAVSATAPTDGQVLTYSSSGANWTPATPLVITSFISSQTAAAAPYTDYVYLGSGTNTIQLPTLTGNTSRYTITNVGTGTITVTTTSSQSIVGTFAAAFSITIPQQGGSVDFVAGGGVWNATWSATSASSTQMGSIILGNDLGGYPGGPTVVGLQGKAVSSTAPTDGQVLTWSASGNNWLPATATGGGNSRSVQSVSTATTANAAAGTDYIYLVSGTTTITLPTAVGNANKYTVTNAGTNTVSVATTSSQTIDGSTTVTLPIANMSLDFISNGTNWVII